ncbi:hypothetical protein [Thiocystis violascens]|uniref:hypothetical protein n=1 Tax=Thiocystis violascens TaxID=73141 RepID=UPI0012F6ABD6|nr:hypothetical protein [Thiocystis violascens]
MANASIATNVIPFPQQQPEPIQEAPKRKRRCRCGYCGELYPTNPETHPISGCCPSCWGVLERVQRVYWTVSGRYDCDQIARAILADPEGKEADDLRFMEAFHDAFREATPYGKALILQMLRRATDENRRAEIKLVSQRKEVEPCSGNAPCLRMVKPAPGRAASIHEASEF